MGKNVAQKIVELLIFQWLCFRRIAEKCAPFKGQTLLDQMKGHYITEKKKKEENFYLPVCIRVIKCL